ncbi:MAG: peptidoglycan-associated lipoprotein Pal [Chlorobiaceae bacterium]|nr:peptidoglycan-associated lipoprotein Pal [Chlorobiaceae bacterium]
MSNTKYFAKAVFIPALFTLGACCCDKDVVVAPVAPAPKTQGDQVAPQAVASVALVSEVYFDFDRSAITPEIQPMLKTNAAWLTANPDRKASIEGHCDERGTSEYNMALGDRRATAVKGYLVQLGVDPARLQTISYGEERPADPGHNEKAWAKNRRVHFVEK